MEFINTTNTHEKDISVLVLGLGNPLMGDDGVGLELMRRVQASGSFGPEVVFEDGGTLGMALLPVLEDARCAILLDAVHTGADAGTVVVRRGEELPGYFSHVISPHQIGLREVLGALQLRETTPDLLVLVGIEAGQTGFGESLSEAVRDAVPAAVETAVFCIGECLRAEQGESGHA